MEMGLFGKKRSGSPETHQTLADLEDGQFPDGPIVVGDTDFDSVIKRFPIVVVDCWAPWCAPCRMIAPIVETMSHDYHGKIVFGKLDTDQNQNTAMKYGIMSIPTLMVFKDGELVDQIVGAMPRPLLEPQIVKYL